MSDEADPTDPAYDEVLRRLWISQKWTDLEITSSDGKVYKVHKAIVCGQSGFLERECMKLLGGSALTVKDDFGILGDVLRHMYGFDFTYYERCVKDCLEIVGLVKLLDAALTYELPSLSAQIELAVLRELPSLSISNVVEAADTLFDEYNEVRHYQNITNELVTRTTLDIHLIMADGRLWERLQYNSRYIKAIIKHLAGNSSEDRRQKCIGDASP